MSQINLPGSGGTPVIPPEVAESITSDNGVAIPVANNVNILGQQAGTVNVMSTNASGNTERIENRAWITQYVVDPSATVGLRGTFQTIQAAITAATGPATIFIRNGTYNENLTLKADVNLAGFSGNGSSQSDTMIVGSMTAAAGVNVIIQNLAFTGNAGPILTATGAGASIFFQDCFLLGTAPASGQAFIATSSASLTFNGCFGTLQSGGFTLTDSQLALNHSYFNQGSVTGGLIATGVSTILFQNSTVILRDMMIGNAASYVAYNSYLGSAGSTISFTGSSSQLQMLNCIVADPVVITSPVILTMINCTVDTSSTTISGTGTLRYAGLNFLNIGEQLTCTGQIPITVSNDAVAVKIPGAYPYTVVSQDAVVPVDTTAARSITLPATSSIGECHVIKDVTGSAFTNNITLNAGSGTIDGAASVLINVNYGSLKVCRLTASQWGII